MSKNKTPQDYSMNTDILSKGMFSRLFSNHLVLTPQLNEIYELALAYYESKILSDDELIGNSAFFIKVGDKLTRHYKMCTGESLRLPKHSSSRLKSFFEKNQFRTGYATHGLFPYRGKFHPQMIRALINVMGLKPGNTILDPMMGSGTVPIEATLMGINSIGIDASPFCVFMTQVKYDALSLPQKPLNLALNKFEAIFKIYSQSVGITDQNYKSNAIKKVSKLIGSYRSNVLNFLLLAYLDSAGYSERSKRKTPLEQFKAILERYVFVVKKIQHVFQGSEEELAVAKIVTGDARSMGIDDQSMDGILFSPPYSFAIDYLANDKFHLNFMGADVKELKEIMVGLRGKNLKEKYHHYIEDMEKILSECSRVLKRGRFCTVIIGTNDNQLSKALNIPKDEIKGLHKITIEIAERYHFSLIRTLARQISGISNTMRNEYIVILKKEF